MFLFAVCNGEHSLRETFVCKTASVLLYCTSV